LRLDFYKTKRKLALPIASGDSQALLQAAAQDHHPALAAPALKPKSVLSSLPALPCIAPALWEKLFLISFLTLAVRRSLNK
jgi:hypothetical protein